MAQDPKLSNQCSAHAIPAPRRLFSRRHLVGVSERKPLIQFDARPSAGALSTPKRIEQRPERRLILKHCTVVWVGTAEKDSHVLCLLLLSTGPVKPLSSGILVSV